MIWLWGKEEYGCKRFKLNSWVDKNKQKIKKCLFVVVVVLLAIQCIQIKCTSKIDFSCRGDYDWVGGYHKEKNAKNIKLTYKIDTEILTLHILFSAFRKFRIIKYNKKKICQ